MTFDQAFFDARGYDIAGKPCGVEAQINTVTAHFITAALWADKPEGLNPRATQQTEQNARRICKAFIKTNRALFDEAMGRSSEGYGSHPDAGSPAAAFGHDLWLTIQGHGVGFWDRKELENLDPEDTGETLGDKLTAACEPYTYKLNPEFYRGWFYLNLYSVESLLTSAGV
jgi:hypothetical protein